MKRNPVPPNLYPPLTPRTRAAPGIRSLVNPPISIEYFKLKTFHDGWKKVQAIRGSLHGSGLSGFPLSIFLLSLVWESAHEAML